jgi:transcriptional regulator with XRE-family HTH domain
LQQVIEKIMNRIKDLLKEKGVTINELADKMGISRVTLSTQINGTANIASYEKIATALNVPMWQLFASSEEVHPKSDSLSLTCPHCGKDISIKVE